MEQQDTFWYCLATVDLRVLHTRGKDKFSNRINTRIFSEKSAWSFIGYMTRAEVCDPNRGYITNDSVTFEVNINAEAPRQLATEMSESIKLWIRSRVLNDENKTLDRTVQELKVKIQQKESENVILKNKLEQKNKENQLQKEIFEIEKRTRSLI